MTDGNPAPAQAVLKRLYRPLILVVFLALFFYYFGGHRQDFAVIRDLSIFSIFLVWLFQMAIMFTNVGFLSSLCRVFQIELSFLRSFAVTVKTSLINFFGFLQGGVGYKAVYLKRHHNLSSKKFLALFAANNVAVFAVSAGMSLLGLLIRRQQGLYVGLGVLLAFLSITVVMTGVMFLKRPIAFKRSNKITRYVNEALEGWHTIAKSSRLVLTLIVLAFLQYLAMTALFYTELVAIGNAPNLAGVMIYGGIANLSLLVAFTPGAIGFREGLLLLAQESMGVSTSAILVTSTIDRTIYFFNLALLALVIQKPVLKTLGIREKLD